MNVLENPASSPYASSASSSKANGVYHSVFATKWFSSVSVIEIGITPYTQVSLTRDGLPSSIQDSADVMASIYS